MSEQNKTAIQLAAAKVTPPPTKAQLIRAAAIILCQEHEKKRNAALELVESTEKVVEKEAFKIVKKSDIELDYKSTGTSMKTGIKTHWFSMGNLSIPVGQHAALDAAAAEHSKASEALNALGYAQSIIDIEKRLKAASAGEAANPVQALVNDPDIRKKLGEAAAQLLNSHENKQAIKV